MKKEQIPLEELSKEEKDKLLDKIGKDTDEFMKWLETQPIFMDIQPSKYNDDITDGFYYFIIDVIMWIAPRRHKCLFAAILFVVLMLFVIIR